MEMQREVHIGGKELLGLVGLRSEEIGKYALVPGSPERLRVILKRLENPLKNFTFFDYTMYTGTYNGQKISVINGGRYSPDSAIIGELLCEAGVEYIIRIGSCGSLCEDIKVGDVIIATGAVRGEGVTPYYVPANFSTVADVEVTHALIESLEKSDLNFRYGLVWTTDALLKETREQVEKMRALKVIGVDMVSSSLLTVAQLKGVKAGSILAVSDNLITGELGFANFLFYEAETKIINLALDTLTIIHERKKEN
ncbi:MAG: hypothetical protein Q8Q41_04405 [bacterium]|nr:hypothetical protein [bacterium]